MGVPVYSRQRYHICVALVVSFDKTRLYDKIIVEIALQLQLAVLLPGFSDSMSHVYRCGLKMRKFSYGALCTARDSKGRLNCGPEQQYLLVGTLRV